MDLLHCLAVIRYPSRGDIIEYLVQSFDEGVFSGSIGILFYLSQLIAIAAVAKSFGAYAETFMPASEHWGNFYAIGIVGLFILINLLGAALVAKSENILAFILEFSFRLFSQRVMQKQIDSQHSPHNE